MVDFKFFDQLKSLISDINLRIKVDFSQFIHINVDQRQINIDFSNATSEELKRALTAAPELNKLIKPKDLIELPEFQQRISEIKSIQEEAKEKPLINFISTKLPKHDISLWISALLVRKSFLEGDRQKVAEIKEQMRTFAGQRGANIANICNAGYLETHIIPLYDHLVKEPKDQGLFERIYESIINDHVFAVFVHQQSNESELREEIIRKIGKIKLYGWDKVYIHAIGYENVKKAKQAVLNVRKENKEIQSAEETSSDIHLKITLNI